MGFHETIIEELRVLRPRKYRIREDGVVDYRALFNIGAHLGCERGKANHQIQSHSKPFFHPVSLMFSLFQHLPTGK